MCRLSVSTSALLVCYSLVVLLGPCLANDLSDVSPDASPSNSEDKPSKIAKPIIKYLHYDSNISNRYAQTVVSSNVANPANVSQEVRFALVTPESAFISEFIIIINGKEYKAYVKEKEEAKKTYDAAVAAGQSAAHVEQSVRDSNRFQVSVNVEAEGKVTFKLTYEELLERSLGVYTHTVNVNPGQIVKDLLVKVNIAEPVDLTTVKVPAFKTENEIEGENEKDDRLAKVVQDPSNRKVANITWSPTIQDQIDIKKEGLTGQLIVQYDVDRSKASQILLDEGYFVHFFTPDKSTAPPLAKHVVFVLDISGSMYGKKIEQLREAMIKILDDLHENDYFSIVLFASDVIVWSPAKTQFLFKNNTYSAYDTTDSEISSIVQRRYKNEILAADKANIALGKEFVEKIFSTDATNIIGGLRVGINITEEGQNRFKTASNGNVPQPIIVFLTDGQPNVDVYDPNLIVNITKEINVIKTPIYSLAFGTGADLQFLRRLSLTNFGFARNIYEASDAALQLNNFYKSISSPLMSDVSFNYLPGQVENGSLTTSHYPVVFRGSEIIVAGKFVNDFNATEPNVEPPVMCSLLRYNITSLKQSDADKDYGFNGGSCVIFPISFPHPELEPVNQTFGHLEKLWAYLNIKQLLDRDTLNHPEQQETNETSPEKQEALRLALKYSFVTPLTSLVVVKPDQSELSVEAEKATEATDYDLVMPLSISGPAFQGSSVASGFAGASFASNVMPMAPMRPMGGAIGPPGYPQYSTPASFNKIPQTTVKSDSQLIPLSNSPNLVPIQSIQWVANRTEDFEIELPSQDGNVTVKFNEPDLEGIECRVNSTNTEGHCRHLQYCALDVFADMFDEYAKNYFCLLTGNFAGVCCPVAPVSLPSSTPLSN